MYGNALYVATLYYLSARGNTRFSGDGIFRREIVMSTVTDVDVIECVIRYYYNVDPAEQVQALLGDVADDYRQQWIHLYNAGFQHWWGTLDDDNKQKYVQLARTKYWGEIEVRRISINIARNKRVTPT